MRVHLWVLPHLPDTYFCSQLLRAVGSILLRSVCVYVCICVCAHT